MQGRLWTVVAIACVLALAVPVVNGGYTEAVGADQNETATVDYQNDTTLNASGTEYVVKSIQASSGQLVEGTDYVVDESAGTVDFQDTPATTDGETVDVFYEALQPDSDTQQGRDILATSGTWLGFALLIGAMGYIVVLIGGGDF